MPRRFYELNGRGNVPGALNLQCPRCGNCAIGYQKSEVPMRIFFTHGTLRATALPVELDKNRPVRCFQCDIEMQSYQEIQKDHFVQGCRGCVICGLFSKDILQTCTECVQEYNPTWCAGCGFNYSRIQAGIDPNELKRQYGIESAPMEEEALERQSEAMFAAQAIYERRTPYEHKEGMIVCE